MIPLKKILKHALKIRCPRCGEGKLFVSYNDLVERCDSCQLVIRAREPDTWFFMYMSTAAITGVFISVMLLLPAPKNQTLGAVLIGVGSLGLFVISTPLRKSLAIGIEFFTDSRSEFPRFPEN
ncbi:hypothetical protein EBQ90_02245 [bacterium]|nr:hypothetical protein [bacterium]